MTSSVRKVCPVQSSVHLSTKLINIKETLKSYFSFTLGTFGHISSAQFLCVSGGYCLVYAGVKRVSRSNTEETNVLIYSCGPVTLSLL